MVPTTEPLATTVSPELKVAAAQAILSEGPVEISEVLRDKREETLVLVQRLLASAGIQVTFSAPKADEPTELAIELQETTWLSEFKTRFNALSNLYEGVEWADVEKSLKADPEAMRKLQALDEKGHEMNVFGEKDGEIQFRSAQTDIAKIAPEHRTIMFDQKAQTDYPQYKVNGNAEDIAASMGVELADKELYEKLRVNNGWVFLKTDATTRKTDAAFSGCSVGVSQVNVNSHSGDGSFCAALRVKKA